MVNVLAVDDRTDNLELMGYFVRIMGHDFVGVDHPEQAIQYLYQTHADVAVIDMALPMMDGLELAAHIKNEIDPRIFIIGVTAAPDHYPESIALAAGCDAYLTKPFSREALHSLLIRAVP